LACVLVGAGCAAPASVSPRAALPDEALGRRCRVDADCGEPGLTCGEADVERPGEKSCTRPCGRGCPRGFECIERAYVSVVGGVTREEVERICAREPPPGTLPFGAACVERHQCAPEAPICLQSGDRRLCTRACADGVCPAGWACHTVQQIAGTQFSATRVCAPAPAAPPTPTPAARTKR
jgi:hypothetical protein